MDEKGGNEFDNKNNGEKRRVRSKKKAESLPQMIEKK